ncbi:MAG TPA: hypothetical protein VMS81_02485, partial [Methanomicrobiales archaeon]|nr:hypothetical protein [Methanomicrobiales archaeon]
MTAIDVPESGIVVQREPIPPGRSWLGPEGPHPPGTAPAPPEPGLPAGPGIVVIDKPRGPSSHQVAAWVGKILGVPVGHAGTLDPGVSGVLVVMLGGAV